MDLVVPAFLFSDAKPRGASFAPSFPQVLTTNDSLRPVLRLSISSVPPVCAEGEVLMSSSEGFSKSRVEAFSDGVMAVILTIMVLDLRAPRSGEPSALLKLWPSFAIYLVSFFLTTIYWINHHSLMTQARHVTARLLWANSGVLFSASFIPFATAYVGETGLAHFPTAIYGALQCVCGLAFGVMFETIVRQRDDEAFRQRVRTRRRQNLVAVAVYAVSVGAAFVSPTVAILLITAVSLAYVAPTFLDGQRGP